MMRVYTSPRWYWDTGKYDLPYSCFKRKIEFTTLYTEKYFDAKDDDIYSRSAVGRTKFLQEEKEKRERKIAERYLKKWGMI